VVPAAKPESVTWWLVTIAESTGVLFP